MWPADTFELARLLQRESLAWANVKVGPGEGVPSSDLFAERPVHRGGLANADAVSRLAGFRLYVPDFKIDGRLEYLVTVSCSKAL